MAKKDDRKAWNSTLRPGKGFKKPKRETVIEFGRAAGKTLLRKEWKPKKRKTTGERALFVALYHQCGGVSQLSGLPLLPPDHADFHKQGSHILPKGAYPRYRLLAENIVMVLAGEHDQWESIKDKERLVDVEPRWKPYVERYYALRLKYNTER